MAITVDQLKEKLELTPYYVEDGEREVTGGYAGDLLSWVMGRATSGDAWVTIMSNINVIAVAQLTDVACVILAEGVVPGDDLIAAVDKGDSADFTLDEILHPQGWVMLHYIMDPRTGLGRFRDFRISNYELMMELIGFCVNHDIEEILALPDVRERVELYNEQAELFEAQLKRIAKVYGKVVVLDLRGEEIIHAGNRFMIYALYPEAQISIPVAWGFQKQNPAVMIGKSIINKASNADIGELCLRYGGGGHRNAGTCQLDNGEVESKLPEIIEALNNA